MRNVLGLNVLAQNGESTFRLQRRVDPFPGEPPSHGGRGRRARCPTEGDIDQQPAAPRRSAAGGVLCGQGDLALINAAARSAVTE